MKALMLYAASVIFSVLLFSGCGANIFSYLNPTVIDVQNDPNVLIGMGENYMNILDYTNAYKAYARAVSLAPKNSRALEGASIAYIYMHFDFSALYAAIMSANYTSLGANNLYAVGSLVSKNLGKIIQGQADGVIPANDVNDNLDFYIFNSFYMIFNTIDSDSDGDINWDTNDYIIMSNNFSTTDRVQSVVSNAGANMDLVPFLGMAYTIDYIKQTAFTNSEQLSYNSINLVNSAMLSSNTKAVVAMISNTFTAMITNLNSFFDFFNTNNLTNLFKVGDYNLLTNLFTNNYAVFTNKLYGQGIWPPSRISNAMPDMVNVYPVLTNYYQHISLDW